MTVMGITLILELIVLNIGQKTFSVFPSVEQNNQQSDNSWTAILHTRNAPSCYLYLNANEQNSFILLHETLYLQNTFNFSYSHPLLF